MEESFTTTVLNDASDNYKLKTGRPRILLGNALTAPHHTTALAAAVGYPLNVHFTDHFPSLDRGSRSYVLLVIAL